MSSTERKYDIIIWGATGYTGTLVVEHYVAHAPTSMKWAVAGRTKSKLVELCAAKKAKVDCLTASVDNLQSLIDLMAQTTVVIACAGPFCKVGTPVVAACLAAGTHYVDITGEVWWIKDLIEKYDTQAKQKNLLIVPACGFDSVPSDLGVFFTVNAVRQKTKTDCAKVKSYWSFKSGVSSGTLNTMMTALRDSKIQKQMKELYLINPPDKKFGNDRLPGVRYDKNVKSWTVPFFMEAANTRVVRRSAAMLDYGRNFSYDEVIKVGFLAAILFFLLEPVIVFLLGLSFIQSLITRFAPAGPTKQELEKGYFSMNFIAELEGKPQKFNTKVQFSRDAYVATAVMVGEAALDIVYNRPNLYPTGGILTPAVALGDALIKRLERHGMKFLVPEENPDKKTQ